MLGNSVKIRKTSCLSVFGNLHKKYEKKSEEATKAFSDFSLWNKRKYGIIEGVWDACLILRSLSLQKLNQDKKSRIRPEKDRTKITRKRKGENKHV